MYWPRLSTQKIKQQIFDALGKNLNYRSEKILGIPATFLDTEIFYDDAPFLKDAPFLSMLIANPNHIGCHTLEGEKEPIFKGSQQIEKDLIRLCSEEIFGAEPGSCDGYVASGGTEANIEALWIYRNYFKSEFHAGNEEIAVVFSKDSHYSFYKACDLLCLQGLVIEVLDDSREINFADLRQKLLSAKENEKKYFIININLSTTMFGSVDDISRICDLLHLLEINYKLHIDGAFGGFIFPFTSPETNYSFKNPNVSSITIDGHKMLQSPYGTGIFLVRKNMMQYVCTEEARYVQGKDYTLCGSRSGANAVCVWMILHMHGSAGWAVKMHQLIDKTTSLCHALDELNVQYYRNPFLNIVTIRAEFVSPELARSYTLVADNHDDPKWYKIVMMPHVRQGVIDEFLSDLKAHLKTKTLTNEPAQ